MSSKALDSLSQDYSVKIQYIYYEPMGRYENVTHSIHYDKIMEWLYEKNFILKRDDIVYLLKSDGAHFYEDSIRIYDWSEKTYFQVPSDWEHVVDKLEPRFSLKFWVKSVNPNFRRKLDQLNEDMKSTKEKLAERVKKVETEVEKLMMKSVILFQQLAKIYKNIALGGDEEQSSLENKRILNELENSQENMILEGPVRHISQVEATSSKLISDSSLMYAERTVSQRQNSSPREIDIALMYSEPLVKRDEQGIILSLGDPVEYEEECSKVIDILKKKEKKINVYFEIATIKNLVNVLSLSPTVLHIMCHGDFNKTRDQFFLCFEENGELVELYSKDLKEILGKINAFGTQLVFVNACHSEEVAKVFVDAGVSCVLAVHSELKIEDSIAQKFSESFYWQLFEGKPIDEAYRNAAAAGIAGKNVFTCCCAHSHKPDCEWYQLAKKEGFEKAHYLHTPACTECSASFGNKFLHKYDCKWAFEFVFKYSNFDAFSKEHFFTCCCSPELQHNEAMKFKLICKEEALGKQVLFRNRDDGKVKITSTHSCLEPKFHIAKMTGRNKEVHDLLSLLMEKEKRIVNLHGLAGVGKTTLAKQVSNYMVERGFFKEKVCLLMLEKTPGIIHFRSSLFKELPGSEDLSTFCKSIKGNKMLFILAKCDKLITEHFDEFIHDVAYIIENAPNVKFVITTQNSVELQLGESHLLMKELKKIDAAKLLCKHAFNFLTWHERNVYKLAENDLFNLIPLTPQAIWSIAEKLKNYKSLEDISAELRFEKTLSNARSEENKAMDETIEKTLECTRGIRKTNPEAYNLVTFICLFPSGLSFQDLEELALKGMIPINWKEILHEVLRTKPFPNKYQSGNLENERDQDTRIRDRSDSIYKKGKKIEKGDFKPDNYIWISITREPVDNDLWFLPTQFITRYVEKKIDSILKEQCIKKHEYLALLTGSLIEKVKENNDYIEKLLESSAVSAYGIWRNPEGKGFDVFKDSNHIQYLSHASYDFNKMKRLVGCHEANLLSCLESKLLDNLFIENDSRTVHVLDVMEIVYLGVPTLFKLMSVKEFGAMEVARKAEQEINHFIDKHPKMMEMKIKLDLFVIALYLGSKSEISNNMGIAKLQSSELSNNFILAKLQVQSIENQEHELVHLPELLAEFYFTKALYLYKAFKNKRLNSTEFLKKIDVYEEINNLLSKAKSKTRHLNENDHYKVFKAKIALAQTKTILNRADFEKKHLDDTKEALVVLNKYGSPRLLMKANYLYASLKFEIEKKNITPRTLENSASEIKEVTAKLVQIKNIYLVGAALDIAKKIKSNLYESKVKRMIDNINKYIRHTYFNVIIIMRSAPIVDIKQGRTSSEYYPNPTGFPTRLASSFKNDVTDMLSASHKVVCLKFEVLTREQLIDSLVHGCRVLQLSCSYVEQNCLCVEGPYGTVERISFEELKDIFSSKFATSSSSSFSFSSSKKPVYEESRVSHNLPQKTLKHGNTDPGKITQKLEGPRFGRQRENACRLESSRSPGIQQPSLYMESKFVDVLILAVKNNPKLVELFIELGIPHIIAFEFLSNESNFRHKNYEDECLENFSLYFYRELLAQKSVASAYYIARDKVFEDLGNKYFEGRSSSYVTDIIGAGPKLFPEDGDHSEVLFGSGRFPLVSGKLEDISSSRCPTNIEKILIPYTGRNLDMYNAMRKLYEKSGFLKVTGVPGIGKTTFVLQLGYHILSRNLFSDGVFYIPLKKLKYRKELQDNEYEMKDLLKDILGPDVQLGYPNFFRDKKMLLIFDDFDLFYKKELEFPRLLFLTLKDYKIPTIVVTSTYSPGNEHNNTKGGKNKHKNSAFNQAKKEIDDEILRKESKLKLDGLSEEELALILQSLIKTDSYKDFASIEELRKCPQVRHAQGKPGYIVDKLVEGKLEVLKIVLKVSPIYEKPLQFESDYIMSLAPILPLSSVSSIAKRTISDVKSIGRTQSVGEGLSQILQTSPKPNNELTKQQQRVNKVEQVSIVRCRLVHKSKSYKVEKKEKGLNKTFDASDKPVKKKEQKRRSTNVQVKKSPGNKLNQSIRSTGSGVEKGIKEVGSQAIIDEKLEDEKGDTDGSEKNTRENIREMEIESIKRVDSTCISELDISGDQENLIRTIERGDRKDEGDGQDRARNEAGEKEEYEDEDEQLDEDEEEEEEDDEDLEEEKEKEKEGHEKLIKSLNLKKDRSSMSAVDGEESFQEKTKNKNQRRLGRTRFSQKRVRNQKTSTTRRKFSHDY